MSIDYFVPTQAAEEVHPVDECLTNLLSLPTFKCIEE